MKMFVKFATAAAVVGIAAVSMTSQSDAATRQKSRSQATAYDSAVRTPDYYSDRPGYRAYGYEPTWNGLSEEGCYLSPASQSYAPCFDH